MPTNHDGLRKGPAVREPGGRPTVRGLGPSALEPLRVERDDGSVVLECALERARYTLGRAEQCDLRLPARDMSREHALLERDARGRWWLVDLGSVSGTFVNGKRLEGRHCLTPYDIVHLSDYRLRLGRPKAQPASRLLLPVGGDAGRPPPARLHVHEGLFEGKELRLDRGEIVVAAGEDATVPLDPDRCRGIRVVVRPRKDGKFDVLDQSATASLMVNGWALTSYVLGDGAVLLRLGPTERAQGGASDGFRMRFLPAERAGGGDAPSAEPSLSAPPAPMSATAPPRESPRSAPTEQGPRPVTELGLGPVTEVGLGPPAPLTPDAPAPDAPTPVAPPHPLEGEAGAPGGGDEAGRVGEATARREAGRRRRAFAAAALLAVLATGGVIALVAPEARVARETRGDATATFAAGATFAASTTLAAGATSVLSATPAVSATPAASATPATSATTASAPMASASATAPGKAAPSATAAPPAPPQPDAPRHRPPAPAAPKPNHNASAGEAAEHRREMCRLRGDCPR